MERKLNALLIILILLLNSCEKDITACISTITTNVQAGNVVTFSSCSQNSKSFLSSTKLGEWDWDFGDGNTAKGEYATNVYTMEGSYTVILTVKDDDGDAVGTATQAITVFQAGNLTFWTDIPYYNLPIVVTVDSVSKSITGNVPSSPVTCGADFCANFTVNTGYHYATAIDRYGNYYYGNYLVDASKCTLVHVHQ